MSAGWRRRLTLAVASAVQPGRLASVAASAGLFACALPPAEPLLLQEGAARIEIESPAPGDTVPLRVLRLPVRGLVALPDAPPPEPRPADLFVLVDVSPATLHPSGQDVDGDGEVGFDPHRVLADLEPGGMVCTDPEDSIRHAEVAAVARLLDHLEGRGHRVGLAFFSRTPSLPEAPSREVGRAAALGLASAFPRLRAALEGALQEAHPAISFDEALEAALGGLRSARPSARRLLLVLDSGAPRSLPIPEAEPVEIWSWTVGQAGGAGQGPEGSRPLQGPLDLLAWLAPLDDSPASTLAIDNLDLGTTSQDVFIGEQGRFSGWLAVREGSNQLRVRVRRPDGGVGTARFRVYVEQELPSHWELLQTLEEIRRGNRELLSLIEGRGLREREAGDLEIRVDPEPEEE